MTTAVRPGYEGCRIAIVTSSSGISRPEAATAVWAIRTRPVQQGTSMCTTVTWRIVDAVRRTGMKYMMAENYCYFHYVREWQKLVEAGKLGDIYYMEDHTV